VNRWFAVTLLSAIAGCGPSGDTLQIYYSFTHGSEQTCETSAGTTIESCSDVPMTCDSVALLRILDPDDDRRVYVDQCAPIPNNVTGDTLCPLTRAFGPLDRFPTKRVEIQLAIYPHEIPNVAPGITDDPITHQPVCPTKIDFTSTGFAAPTNEIMPAFAGRAFADGYDNEVTVELGCSDPGLIDTDFCRDENALDVTASVLDFDQQVTVSTDDAQKISVRVGEPRQLLTNWEFDIADTLELPLIVPPGNEWGAINVNVPLVDYACIQALELMGRAVATLNCRTLTAPVPNALDLTGYRVSGTTLNEVFSALGLTELPQGGMVIGIVVNVQTGLPEEGVTVMDDGGSMVEYLSADRTMVGGTTTSTAGIFIANDAAATFEVDGVANHWRATKPTRIQINDPIGGLVNFRLSVVVIQMDVAF
jgi:hypothetical protein